MKDKKIFIQQCETMDALPLSKRREAIAFSKAITAIEGLPTDVEIEKKMGLWAKGKLSYSEIYLAELRKYNVIK